MIKNFVWLLVGVVVAFVIYNTANTQANSIVLANQSFDIMVGKKCVATLRQSGDGAGLWLEGPDNKMVAIYSVNGQTGIGLFGKDRTKAMPIGFSVDDNDEPYIQLRKGNKTLMLGFDELAVLKKQ